jgi:hypothetical protein
MAPGFRIAVWNISKLAIMDKETYKALKPISRFSVDIKVRGKIECLIILKTLKPG